VVLLADKVLLFYGQSLIWRIIRHVMFVMRWPGDACRGQFFFFLLFDHLFLLFGQVLLLRDPRYWLTILFRSWLLLLYLRFLLLLTYPGDSTAFRRCCIFLVGFFVICLILTVEVHFLLLLLNFHFTVPHLLLIQLLSLLTKRHIHWILIVTRTYRHIEYVFLLSFWSLLIHPKWR